MYLARKKVQGYSNIQGIHLSQISVSLEMFVICIKLSWNSTVQKQVQTTAALNSPFLCTFSQTLKEKFALRKKCWVFLFLYCLPADFFFFYLFRVTAQLFPIPSKSPHSFWPEMHLLHLERTLKLFWKVFCQLTHILDKPMLKVEPCSEESKILHFYYPLLQCLLDPQKSTHFQL